MMNASSQAKPQLAFADAVDNSGKAAWTPQLTHKPHGLVPLGFEPPLEFELTPEEREDPKLANARRIKEVKLRRHPYFYETRHLPYPTSMFTIASPIKPRSMEETPLTFVDTAEKLEAMVEKLKEAKEIAVDLEHHSMRSYYGFTCLMQISTREEDWVVDTLSLRAELREHKLGGVLMDPAIIKVSRDCLAGCCVRLRSDSQVFHGSDSDIIWLQQDFDIYVVNLFDTYHATRVLGEWGVWLFTTRALG